MTREEELALLIAEQRADDTHVIRPERGHENDARLDTTGLVGNRNLSMYDLVEQGDDGCRLNIPPTKGRVLVGGKIGGFQHGTLNGYNNHRCKCLECKAAKAAYMRERRARRSQE